MTTANLSQTELPAPPIEKELPVPQYHDTDSKPLIILLLIVLLIAILGMGGIFLWTKQTSQSNSAQPLKNFNFSTLTPTPNPNNNIEATNSANWKTYTNTKLGYSFKYPSTWICPDNFGGGQTYTSIYFCSATIQPLDDIWTSYTNNPQNLSFQQLVTQNLSSDIKNNFKYTTTTVGLRPAYITRGLPGASEYESVYIMLPNNGYVGISYQPFSAVSGFSENYANYKIFQQILSTFKFIN